MDNIKHVWSLVDKYLPAIVHENTYPFVRNRIEDVDVTKVRLMPLRVTSATVNDDELVIVCTYDEISIKGLRFPVDALDDVYHASADGPEEVIVKYKLATASTEVPDFILIDDEYLADMKNNLENYRIMALVRT